MLLMIVGHPPLVVQEWTCRKIGFGLPHLPYGRWYSQVPNATPVVVAVGVPLPVPHVPEPDEALVNKYGVLYFVFRVPACPRATMPIHDVVLSSPLPPFSALDCQFYRYHRMYYDRVREAFEAHKAEAGAPNCELIFKDR